MEIVINGCFGGFGLSDEAEELYAKKAGFDIFRYTEKGGKFIRGSSKSWFSHTFTKDHGDSFDKFPTGDDSGYWYSRDIDRNCSILVEVVKELGESASGSCGALEVIEIPDGVDYEIEDYDGLESIHENHRSWS